MGEPLHAFITTMAEAPLRLGLAQTTLGWWIQEARRGRVQAHVFDIGAASRLWDRLREDWGTPLPLVVEPMPREDSNRRRHAWAAARARTEVYVVADDDLLPARRTCLRTAENRPTLWCDYVRDAMARHPAWGLVSALVVPGGVDPYATAAALRRDGVGISAAEADVIERALALPVAADGERWPVGNCGGVRVMRRGVVVDDPPLPPVDPECGGGYDGTLCGYVRDRGYQVGRLVRWRATHAGEEESHIWRGGGRDED